MYILKNSILSIIRNKGRNILIGVIIFAIACSATITLAIRNTANNIVESYEDSNDLIATISFDRSKLMGEFKGGESNKKENIETFNNIESYTLDDVKNFGESEYLKGYYYTYSTSLDSDTLTKAEDSFEIENNEELLNDKNDKNQEAKAAPKEKFESAKNLTGDFKIEGYSSYDAMTDFINGTLKITSGSMISDFSSNECVINEELATLNNITVGSEITLKNSNTDKTYDFVVTGIYTDSSDTNEASKMYSQSANTIIVASNVVETLVSDDNTIVTNLTPSFILKGENVLDKFKEEVKQKGLNDYYQINTNLEEIESATKSIQNVKTFATTFLVIMLIISSLVLFVINMINIRERKYEIGVFRTIGMSKFKLTMQFMLEILIVALVSLIIGALVGGLLAKPVGNMLLSNEIENSQNSQEQVFENFGVGGKSDMPRMQFNNKNSIEMIDSLNAVVDFKVILELLGIGILVTLISSLASMISIQRFTPLTILKERT